MEEDRNVSKILIGKLQERDLWEDVDEHGRTRLEKSFKKIGVNTRNLIDLRIEIIGKSL